MSGTMATTCPDCGTTNDPANTFCEVCGRNLATGEEPAPPPAPAAFTAVPSPAASGNGAATHVASTAAGAPSTGAGPDIDTDTDLDAGPDSDRGAGPDSDLGAGRDSDLGAAPDIPFDAALDPHAGAGLDTDAAHQVPGQDPNGAAGQAADPGPDGGRDQGLDGGADQIREPDVADPTAGAATWFAVIDVDAEFFASNQAADHTGTLALPTEVAPRQVPMVGDDLLIGRRSSTRRISPAIDLSVAPQDSGVSHRHATFSRRGEGWCVTDLGSTNGSWVAGDPDALEPFVEQPIRDGDSLLIGAWTRITVRRLAPPAADDEADDAADDEAGHP